MPTQQNFFINENLINPQQNQITHQDAVQTIEPKVMETLLLLVNQVGKVISRSEITESIWKKQVVCSNSINRHIVILRKILDRNSVQSCIQTIPKRGYLLNAEIYPVDSSKMPQAPLLAIDKEQNVGIKNKDYPLIQLVGKQTIWSVLLFAIIFMVFNFLRKTQLITPDHSIVDLALFDSNTSNEVDYSLSLNKTFYLDGLDDYVEIKEDSNLMIGTGDFSISVWIKTQADGLMTIVDKRYSSPSGNIRGFSLFLQNGYIGFQLADGNGSWICNQGINQSSCTNYVLPVNVADNQWHQLAITVDRDELSGLKFYSDGALVAQRSPIIRNGSLSTNAPLRIGSRSSSVSSLFEGQIKHLKIFNQRLSHDTVVKNYQNGVYK